MAKINGKNRCIGEQGRSIFAQSPLGSLAKLEEGFRFRINNDSFNNKITIAYFGTYIYEAFVFVFFKSKHTSYAVDMPVNKVSA